MSVSTFQTDCMLSSVRNISGSAMYFDFLPPHGVKLANHGEYTCIGNIMSFVGMGLGGQRAILRLEQMVNDGLLEIKYTPSPVFWDKGRIRISLMQVYNDKLVVMQPCWGSSGPVIGND